MYAASIHNPVLVATVVRSICLTNPHEEQMARVDRIASGNKRHIIKDKPK